MKTIVLVAFFTICYVVCMDLVNSYMKSIDFESKEVVNNEDRPSIYSVSISGEVVNPGIYSVNKDSTLGYLITLAGGLKDNADITCFNSNILVSKGSSYYIPYKTLNENNESTKISLNTASQLVLDSSLPGVGEVFSQRIVEYRTQNGGFKTIDELKNVKGIGESLFNELKDLVCL